MVCLQCKHPWAFTPSLLQVVHHAEECKGGAESCGEDDACRTKFGTYSVKLTLKYHATYKHACTHTQPTKPYDVVLEWGSLEVAEQLCIIENTLFSRIGER